MNDNLIMSFRKLRNAWFIKHIISHSPEREWEDEHDAQLREWYNSESKRMFDEHTEMFISGEILPDYRLIPTCGHDLSRDL